VVALSLLIAVRQGREHADAARLDVRALQARQQESRVQVSQADSRQLTGLWLHCMFHHRSNSSSSSSSWYPSGVSREGQACLYKY
jgi:hypothetical protein